MTNRGTGVSGNRSAGNAIRGGGNWLSKLGENGFGNAATTVFQLQEGVAAAAEGGAQVPAQKSQPQPVPADVPRWPDFFSININVAVPTPWTGTLVGVTGSATIDENGDVYLGFGPNIGKAATVFSGSAGFGWMNQMASPTESELKSFLMGNAVNVGGGFWGGGGITYSPTTGTTATNLGFYSPQAGVGYTYSWHVGDLWK